MDEAVQREYGYALAGEVSSKRFVERHSVIAGLSGGKALAPWGFNGYCDTEVVLTWVKPVMAPELKPGLSVVMDNASFHKAAAIRETMENAGCELLFLPPYSPDLNPVAKRTEGHLKHSGLSLKPGFVKCPLPYFPYSNWLTASFKTLINYEISYRA